jgi:hypothetical protein
MICLTAIGLSPGGSTLLHTNNTYNNTNNNRTTQITTNVEECGPCPVFASFILAFALQLKKKQGKTSVRLRKTSEYSIHITQTLTHHKTHTHTPYKHKHTHTHTNTHIHTHKHTTLTHTQTDTPYKYKHTHTNTSTYTHKHTHTIPLLNYVADNNLYGSHCFLFVTKQTTFIQPHTTQVYYNSVGHIYIVLHVSACT